MLLRAPQARLACSGLPFFPTLPTPLLLRAPVTVPPSHAWLPRVCQVFELDAGADSRAAWQEVSLLHRCTHRRIVPLLGVALKVCVCVCGVGEWVAGDGVAGGARGGVGGPGGGGLKGGKRVCLSRR